MKHPILEFDISYPAAQYIKQKSHVSRELLMYVYIHYVSRYRYLPSENLNPLGFASSTHAIREATSLPFRYCDTQSSIRSRVLFLVEITFLPAMLNNLTPREAWIEAEKVSRISARVSECIMNDYRHARLAIRSRAVSPSEDYGVISFCAIGTAINGHNKWRESVGHSKCHDSSISHLPWREKFKRERSAGYL